MLFRSVPPPDVPMDYVNKRTGQTYHGIMGITPGFEYNPGDPASRSASIAHTGQSATNAYQTAVVSNTEPKQSSLKTPVSDGYTSIKKPIRQEAQHAMDCIKTVHGDGKLPGIPMKDSKAKSFCGEFRYSMGKAVDVLISTKNPAHVEFTILHETGHYLDNAAFPKNGNGTYASYSPGTQKMQDLIQALGNSNAIQEIRKANYKVSYYSDPTEMIARSYAQYIAVKTQDPILASQLQGILNAKTNYHLSQWTDADFQPIIKAYDNLLEEMGWLKRK